MRNDRGLRRQNSLYLAISQIGTEMVAPTVIGLFLDRWLGTTPWIMAGGTICGFVGGIIHLVALVKQLDRSDSPPRQRDGS